MRKIEKIAEIGTELIEEVEGMISNGITDRIAKSFQTIEKLNPLTAFFLGATIIQFHDDTEVSNEIADQAFVAAGLLDNESERIH